MVRMISGFERLRGTVLFRTTIACLFLCFVLHCTVVFAQDPTTPLPTLKDDATSGNLGSYLETAFQKQLGVCITGSPKPHTLTLTKGLSHKPMSAIPPPLTDQSLKLSDDVSIGFDASVGRTFAYIYTTKNLLTATPDVSNYVISAYLEDPALLTTSGLDKALYDFSCSASIAASMKVNSKWSFPPADVSAAVSGDLNSKATYHVSLVSGTFYSPIWQQYTSTTDSDWRTYARMLLWEWYSRHAKAASDGIPRFVLTQFNGLSLYKIMTSSFSTDGQADASLALSLPAVSAQGRIQTSYNEDSKATVESFGILVRHKAASKAEDDVFQSVPALPDLAKKLSAVGKTHLDPSTDHTLFQNTVHTQRINGIPQVICTGSWGISPGSNADGTLSVVGTPTYSEPSDVTIPPYCKVVIAYQLNAPPSATSKENLAYALTTDIQDDNGTTIATARFTAEQVSLSASGKPSISDESSSGLSSPPGLSPIPGTGVTAFTYDWTLTYPVAEDSAAADQVASVSKDVVASDLKCENSTDITPLTASASFASGQLTITLEHKNSDDKEKIDFSKFTRVCSYSGKVTFTLKNGFPVNADVPSTRVFYSPAILPVPAPAPTPAPAPVQRVGA